MTDSRFTEERLRSWLDANQVQRERLCAQLLPLLGPYSHVEPRRPKGGPDGSRDLQAIYDGQPVWGAIGFRNSAKDSDEDKRWIRDKFKADLDSALAENPSLRGFVFFTNIDLTPGEQEELKAFAKRKNLGHVDLFIRERIRLVLDSIEGWGYRLQFLEIEMSREEQLAFIERYGARLESALEMQRRDLNELRDRLDKQLKRIEFMHDCQRPLQRVTLLLEFNRERTASQLGAFRFLVELRDYEPESPWPTLWLCGRDQYYGMSSDGSVGVANLVWSLNPDQVLDISSGQGFGMESSQLYATYHPHGRGPFKKLGDLHNCSMGVFASEPLFEELKGVSLLANDYVLAAEHVAYLETLPHRPSCTWPVDLKPSEEELPWVRLVARGSQSMMGRFGGIANPWDLSFANRTPTRLERPEGFRIPPGMAVWP